RLRRLLADIPEVTFGRYVGETEHTLDRAESAFRSRYPSEPRLPNELIAREQMQAAPPQILLTNYAMLEYLLLRPDDSALFDDSSSPKQPTNFRSMRSGCFMKRFVMVRVPARFTRSHRQAHQARRPPAMSNQRRTSTTCSRVRTMSSSCSRFLRKGQLSFARR